MPTDEAGRVALSHIRSDPRDGRALSSALAAPTQGAHVAALAGSSLPDRDRTEEGRRRRAGPLGPLDTASGVLSTSPDAASNITDSTTVDPHRQEAARVADAGGVLEDVQILLRADTATKPGSVL